MKRTLPVIALAMWIPTNSMAQAKKHITTQDLVWFAYTSTYKFNDHWSVSLDVQERRFINPGAQHQFLIRPTLIRSLGSGWDAGFGGCVFWQSPQDPYSTSTLVVPELRPHAELNQRQKLRYFNINQRYKVEARFFHNTEGQELASGYTFGSIRIRYRFGIDVPLVRTADKKLDRLTFRVNDEILINAGEKIVANTFDNNRFYVGLASNITPGLAVEVGYMNWFQERSSGKDFYDRNIARIAIAQKFGSHKKATPSTAPAEPSKN